MQNRAQTAPPPSKKPRLVIADSLGTPSSSPSSSPQGTVQCSSPSSLSSSFLDPHFEARPLPDQERFGFVSENGCLLTYGSETLRFKDVNWMKEYCRMRPSLFRVIRSKKKKEMDCLILQCVLASGKTQCATRRTLVQIDALSWRLTQQGKCTHRPLSKSDIEQEDIQFTLPMCLKESLAKFNELKSQRLLLAVKAFDPPYSDHLDEKAIINHVHRQKALRLTGDIQGKVSRTVISVLQSFLWTVPLADDFIPHMNDRKHTIIRVSQEVIAPENFQLILSTPTLLLNAYLQWQISNGVGLANIDQTELPVIERFPGILVGTEAPLHQMRPLAIAITTKSDLPAYRSIMLKIKHAVELYCNEYRHKTEDEKTDSHDEIKGLASPQMEPPLLQQPVYPSFSTSSSSSSSFLTSSAAMDPPSSSSDFSHLFPLSRAFWRLKKVLERRRLSWRMTGTGNPHMEKQTAHWHPMKDSKHLIHAGS